MPYIPFLPGSAASRLRIHVLSDLHIEFGDWSPPQTDADLVVLAGDILTGCNGLAWARERFPGKRIIYVLGNHEFYGERMDDLLRRSRADACRLGVHLLEGDEVVIDGVRFLGATMWTDFELAGEGPGSLGYSMWIAGRSMSDFALIRHRSGLFRPEDSREIHLERRSWLRRKLAERFSGRTVVITHHLPHARSIHRRFRGHPLNAGFASHMPELVRSPVDLWIHGHTHCSCDYVVQRTRVLCNPRGYAPVDLNPDFKPGLVVDM